MSEYIDIVFDGPPSQKAGRFVEAENAEGYSIRAGEWIDGGKFWRLRIPVYKTELAAMTKERDEQRDEIAKLNLQLCFDKSKTTNQALVKSARLKQRVRQDKIEKLVKELKKIL